MGLGKLAELRRLISDWPDLLQEWDFSKNLDLSPSSTTYGSKKDVWWKCEKGHSWKARPNSRTAMKSGCPYCSHRRILVGFNDLATIRPDLVREWDYEKNYPLDPTSIAAKSGVSIFWTGKCGHSWKTSLASRVAENTGCPYCAGQKVLKGFNDLATTRPDLAREWDYEKNQLFTPESISKGSDKKAWWVGSKCGHSWQSAIKNRGTKNHGCPYCAGQKVLKGFNDLTTTHPHLAREWDYEQNYPLTPEQVSKGSGKQFWWVGYDCGHSWRARVTERVARAYGCTVCSGNSISVGINDLVTANPEIAGQWHYEKNNPLTPESVTKSSGKKVWWQCSKGHEWQATINDRTGGHNCPTCVAKTFVSKGEKEVLEFVQSLSSDVVGTYRDLIDVHEVDIYIPSKNLAIEYNGVYWHSEDQKGKNYHYEKWKACKDQGVQLIQIWDDEWRDKKDIIKNSLAHKLGASKSAVVYARQTLVTTLSAKDTKIFLSTHHIQGFAGGSVRLGLVDNSGSVVACGVFKKRTDTEYELVRYATAARVAGGLSKLLKNFARTHSHVARIITFADHCVSNGNMYTKLGFVADKELTPDYKYLVNGTRVHKFNYRLTNFKNNPNLLFLDGVTERGLAKLNSLPRVYDAGKTRFVLALR